MHRFLTLAAATLLTLAPLAAPVAADDCTATLAVGEAGNLELSPTPGLAELGLDELGLTELALDETIALGAGSIGVGWSCEVVSNTCLTQYACQGPEGPAHPRVVVEKCCPPPCTNPPCHLQVCQFRNSTTCSC